MRRVTGSLRTIRRRVRIAKCIRPRPVGPDSVDDGIDLLLREHAAGTLREESDRLIAVGTDRGAVGHVDRASRAGAAASGSEGGGAYRATTTARSDADSSTAASCEERRSAAAADGSYTGPVYAAASGGHLQREGNLLLRSNAIDDGDNRRLAAAATRQARRLLVEGPVLATRLRLAAPTVALMLLQAVIAAGEAAFVGRLGSHALAGISLGFPLVMLMTTLSAGAYGGGVASGVARALGAGRPDVAARLAGTALGMSALLGVFCIEARRVIALPRADE